MSIPHLDVEVMRELQIIMGEDFAHLLETFATDSAARIVAVQQAAEVANGEALRREAHSFKGSTGNMGALRLSELCRQIEECARDGALEQCAPLVAQLGTEFAIVQREINHFVRCADDR
ncbi:MAG TPA: Hpt domain-containing protein [Spongiibacteraceae bacterium]|nr:Hpt domain-containing protein [Spongiibacteraceae bacterium]